MPDRSPLDDGTLPGALVYLYVGSADVSADLGWYAEVMGATAVWRVQAHGADVAAVRIGAGGPVVVLASHRPVPSCMPIWAVDDVDGLVRYLRAAGWADTAVRIDIPDGPCLVLEDRSGNELALLRQDRPDAIEQRLRS